MLLQASAAELEVALQERGALEVDGCWSVMSGALLEDTLRCCCCSPISSQGYCVAGERCRAEGSAKGEGRPWRLTGAGG